MKYYAVKPDLASRNRGFGVQAACYRWQVVVASCEPCLTPYQLYCLALKLDRLPGNTLSQ
jgi:hypothetical protein